MDSVTLARRWARVVSAARDPKLAVGYVRSELVELSELDADLAAGALSVVLADVAGHADHAPGLLLVIGAVLAPAEMAPLRERLALAAESAGLFEVQAVLGPHRLSSALGGPEVDKVPDLGRGRPLALGERKSLARVRDRHLLRRVLADPHPDVIRILLGNPTLTEDDVVRLAARRPVHSDVLREVASSVRWIVRYGVRLTVVRNPYTPIEVALPLMPLVSAQDLAEIANSPELAPTLRALAGRGPPTLH